MMQYNKITQTENKNVIIYVLADVLSLYIVYHFVYIATNI